MQTRCRILRTLGAATWQPVRRWHGQPHDPIKFGPLICSSATGLRIASSNGVLYPPKSDDPDTYAIIGAAIEVYRVLGAGFLEIFYKDALAIELALRKIPFRRELPISIEYKGEPIRGEYRMDFVCYEQIVLEVKARSNTGPADHAQVISYLASSKRRVGLLLNFGGAKLEHRRFVWTPHDLRDAALPPPE